ncbi:MAG: site-specific integrase [Spirochaetaceae bacterium]|jgi:integrase|nr:site-specific integrase [Spirochaetaceae bacterium]
MKGLERGFYLYQKRGFWYVRLLTAEGATIGARSTGTKDREAAYLKALDWKRNGLPAARAKLPCAGVTNTDERVTPETALCVEGILRGIKRADLSGADAMRIVAALKQRELIDIAACPAGKGQAELVPALLDFWNYETSPYIEDRLAHGHRIGRAHCEVTLRHVRKHWAASFEGRTVASITRQDLKDFGLSLAKGGLSAGSVNSIMNAGAAAFGYWQREGVIAANPAAKLERFGGAGKGRGILTADEAAALFARQWADTRAKAGNLTAATTGLRLGEVLALQARDIGRDVLHVRHSWSDADGLKAPKNWHERKVPLLPEVREALLAVLATNPHTDIPEAERFVFWGLKPDVPRVDGGLLNGLRAELDAMGIDRRGRNIVFHGWRHFYAALITDRVDAGKVKKITGHLTRAMLDHYADHETDEALEAARTAGRFVFARLVGAA